jgi:hypothetical protein
LQQQQSEQTARDVRFGVLSVTSHVGVRPYNPNKNADNTTVAMGECRAITSKVCEQNQYIQ